MASELKVDTIRNQGNTVNIPVSSLKRRITQRITRNYKPIGIWNPGNSYYPMPGSFLSITPMYDDSYLVYSYTCPVGHVWNAHSISHWILMANGTEYLRFCKSNHHIENAHISKWEIPSWGAGQTGNIGFMTRNYSSGNHGVHFNGRRYIDGSDSSRSVDVFISLEEYTRL